MCGRYALGAAHIDFLEGLQDQYARLFPGRRDGGPDGARVRGGGGGGHGRGPQRLRGGGAGGQDPSLDTAEASSSQDAASSSHMQLERESKANPCMPVAKEEGIKWEREQDFWPSYNIAPRQRAPVVRRDPSTGDVMMETMQWGLIPHWTKFPPTGPLNTINARSEALIDPSSGGMWHALKGYKRCVIPAQGYYEWQKKGTTKVAHFTRLPLHDNDTASAPPILFFAGLWDQVTYSAPVPSKFVPKEGDDREPYPTGNPVPLSTFTILTTTPAKDIAWLHDRMPCVLTDQDEIARWLDLGEPPQGWKDGKGGTADLLHSFTGLASYPVVPEVGKIGHSEQNYILPVAERKDGIKSFFQKQAASPVKAKAKLEHDHVKEDIKPVAETPTESKPKPESKADVKPPRKDAPQVVVVDDDEDEVKPTASQTDTPGKRKREIQDPPRGGRQTKVVRQQPKEESKGQPSITSFFKSPSKKK